MQGKSSNHKFYRKEADCLKLKNAVCALLLGAFFIIPASGCNITDFSTDNLLWPPKTMGDEAEIEQLISSAAGTGYTLKYPKNGNYRSAITMIDLDGDDTEEAVAFYRKGDEAEIHMLVMYSDDGEWKLSADKVIESTDIDSVDFADINGSGTLEIIAGYTTYTTNINSLVCCEYSDGDTGEIKSGQSFSNFYCGDFDSDGIDEIMLLTLYTTENEASAAMLDYSEENNSLYSKATVKTDPNVTKYKNVAVTSFSDGICGVVIDGAFANEEINTQVIYYSKELSLLRNPLYSEKEANVTQRSSSVISSDIDNDDEIEIPVVSKLPHTSEQSSDSVADKIEWDSFSPDDESVSPDVYMAANYDFGYTVKLPDSLLDDKATALIDSENSTLTFYEWNKNKLGDMLFEIKAFTVDDWNIGKDAEDYTLIAKDDSYAYTFKNNSDSELSLTDDEIKTAFSFLTEITV